MGDKFANILIVFIMIIILGLGGIYYVKVTGSYNYSVEEGSSYSEVIENALNEDINDVKNNTQTNQLTEGNNIYASQNAKSGYKYNNRNYYNGLNEEEKAIYDTIVNNIDKLKTGNTRIRIEYDFSKILDSKNGEELLDNYYRNVIHAINLDIPNLFYLNFSKLSLSIEKKSSLFSTKYKLYIDKGKNDNYFLEGFVSGAQTEVAVTQVETAKDQIVKTMTGTDYQKTKMVHDWLINYMTYDSQSNNRASVYGAFIEKKGVCESYARTYKYILDELGIENILVTGVATNSKGETEDHMWNYVKLDGKWYAVDATWDDPIIIGGGIATEETKYRYFLKGSREFNTNHEAKETISSTNRVFKLPELEVNNY